MPGCSADDTAIGRYAGSAHRRRARARDHARYHRGARGCERDCRAQRRRPSGDFDGNGTVDRGLWQINSVHTQFSPACDYDTLCAAKAAFSISAEGTDWEPWVTYQHGAEIPFLPEATAYVESAGSAS